jgi:hypothetical protein
MDSMHPVGCSDYQQSSTSCCRLQTQLRKQRFEQSLTPPDIQTTNDMNNSKYERHYGLPAKTDNPRKEWPIQS